MSIDTPTTAEIADVIASQIEVRLGQDVPLLPRSFIRLLSRALAGVFVLVFKYAGWSSLQMFVDHASMDETIIAGRRIRPLVEWGRLVGEGDPDLATQAELIVNVNVTAQGGFLRSGSQLLKASTGVTYITVATVELDNDVIQVRIRAVADKQGGGGAGSIGNLESGDTVDFANPLPGVRRRTVVVEQAITGANAETVTAYRQRIRQRFQRRPQGGAYADYQQWATSVEGITSAFPYTGDPGRVNVYVEATEDSSGSEDGIPTQAQLAAVEQAIEFDQDGLASRRPAGALVTAHPIERVEFDIDVTGLNVTEPASVQESIVSAVDEWLRNREPFIVGLSVLPRRDRIAQTAVAGLVDTIVSTAGGTFDGVTLYFGGVPINAYNLDEGEKAKLNEANFS